MILKDKLKELNNEEDVFIGSRSAFFYIGKPDEFMDVVDELNEGWYKNFKRTLTRLKQSKTTLEKQKPKVGETEVKKIIDLTSHKPVEVEVSYENRIKSWNKKYSEVQDSLRHYTKVVEKWKNFENRKVKECYRNIDNNATIIIVPGYEVSRFWFKHEYDDFKQRGDKSVGYSGGIME